MWKTMYSEKLTDNCTSLQNKKFKRFCLQKWYQKITQSAKERLQLNAVMGETTLRLPYAEHARHGCHFMNAFVLLALFRPQAGKEVSGFNFL